MIVDLKRTYYSYDNFMTDAMQLEREYKEILHNVTIGESHDNRDIVMLRLGTGKHYMIISSGVHARETINPIVLLKIIEYYADMYVNHKQQKQSLKKKLMNQKQLQKTEYGQMLYGACIYELLQTFTLLFVPLVNPDGYMIALDGFHAIRDNKLRDDCIAGKQLSTEWKANARGVDINRNFPSRLWIRKNASDQVASENETKAMIQLFQQYKAKGYLDFHSRGKQIYYYRNQMAESYNARQQEIARRLNKVTNYTLMQPENETDTGDGGGNTVHYFSEQFGRPAITIETVDEEAIFPLDSGFRNITFEEVKYVISEFGSLIIR